MRDYLAFQEAIGMRESSNNYKAVNKFGYLGKYQFGKPRLYDLGYSIDGWHPKNQPVKKIISTSEFLLNKNLQDYLFYVHCKQLVNIILKRYKQFIGKKINDVEITLSGLVAGAHLVGLGGVIKFLAKKIDVKDGNGVPVSRYIKEFANYNLEILYEG